MLKIYQLRLKQNSFDVVLKYKGVSVRVAFIDGNTYNGTPAKCYASDTFKQKAIENSKMFKDREIVLERSVEDENDRKAAAVKAARVSMAPKPAAKKTAKPAAKPAPKPAPVKNEEPSGAAPEEKLDADGLKKMEFTLAEAIQYIATNYQQQVQTPNEARAFLKEKGIKATIKNG